MQDDAQGFRREPAPRPEGDVNRNILLLTGISVAVSAFFASFYPGPLILPVLSTLLLLTALASSLTAAVMAQRIFDERLNFWDKAMFLVFAGLVAGTFVDTEAVTAFLEAQQGPQPSAPAAPDAG